METCVARRLTRNPTRTLPTSDRQMHSHHHFPISVAVGLGLAATLSTPLPWPALVGGAGLLGTFVDLDHFLIARARTGSWRHFRRCLADPRMGLLEQDEIFEDGDVGTLTRLGSHLVSTAALVAALAPLDRQLAVATGVVLAVHILSDVVWDLWRWQRGSDG